MDPELPPDAIDDERSSAGEKNSHWRQISAAILLVLLVVEFLVPGFVIGFYMQQTRLPHQWHEETSADRVMEMLFAPALKLMEVSSSYHDVMHWEFKLVARDFPG